LIRHGKTQWNLEKRIQGKNNPPLCPQGILEVEKWGNFIKNAKKWDRIVTSSLQRTWETAHIINKDLKLPLDKDERLDEQDWGVWNGKTKKDLCDGHFRELEYQMALGWRFCPPGGENRLAVWQRSRNAFADLSGRFSGKNILVITHIGVIKAIVYGILKRKFLPEEPALLKPNYLHLLAWQHNDLIIRNLNAVCFSGCL
jgi:probable phosphoglycerate mutase